MKSIEAIRICFDQSLRVPQSRFQFPDGQIRISHDEPQSNILRISS
jgi:hypothetical protein